MPRSRRSLGAPPSSRASRHAMLRNGVASTVGVVALLVSHQQADAPWASLRVATVPVVVATRDMPEGVIVDRSALVVAQWPTGTEPAGAYAMVDSVANRITHVRIYKGEAILANRLAPAGAKSELATRITPGMRAYGIRINDVASLAGMIQPNSRVDIMVVDYDPEQGKRVAKLFMSNKRVLAIGSTPERAQFGRSIGSAVASIEVDSDEAEKLAITAAQAPLQLVLRGSNDDPNASSAIEGSTSPRSVNASPARRRNRASDRSRIVPSTPRTESLPPTVFRRGRGAGVVQTDSGRSRPN